MKKLFCQMIDSKFYFLWLDDLTKEEGINLLELEMCVWEQEEG